MANISTTYTFTNGTTIDADEVNQNFSDLVDGTLDGTKDFAISALSCAGNASFNGNVTLGNASGDDVTVTGSLASNLVPKTTETYALGTSLIGYSAMYLGDNSQTVGVVANTAASADYTLMLPPAAGVKGQVLQNQGSAALAWVPGQTDIYAASADYTVLDNDGYRHVQVTTGASAVTVTLPTAADNTDRIITISKVDSGAGAVTIDGEGAETIDGAASRLLYGQYNDVTLVCSGSQWFTLGGSKIVYQTKTDTTTYTGGATLTNVGFSNLVVGQTYRFSADFTAGMTGTSGAEKVEVSWNNVDIALEARTDQYNVADLREFKMGTSKIFVSTGLAIVATLTINGTASLNKVSATLEHLPNHLVSTMF